MCLFCFFAVWREVKGGIVGPGKEPPVITQWPVGVLTRALRSAVERTTFRARLTVFCC